MGTNLAVNFVQSILFNKIHTARVNQYLESSNLSLNLVPQYDWIKEKSRDNPMGTMVLVEMEGKKYLEATDILNANVSLQRGAKIVFGRTTWY